MRPDRLVVGEVRGAEVTRLAALNTGHEGGCNANSATGVPARLEARLCCLPLTGGLASASGCNPLML